MAPLMNMTAIPSLNSGDKNNGIETLHTSKSHHNVSQSGVYLGLQLLARLHDDPKAALPYLSSLLNSARIVIAGGDTVMGIFKKALTPSLPYCTLLVQVAEGKRRSVAFPSKRDMAWLEELVSAVSGSPSMAALMAAAQDPPDLGVKLLQGAMQGTTQSLPAAQAIIRLHLQSLSQPRAKTSKKPTDMVWLEGLASIAPSSPSMLALMAAAQNPLILGPAMQEANHPHCLSRIKTVQLTGAASEVSQGQYTPGAGLAILQNATRHQPGRYPECTKLLRCVDLEPWKGLLWLRKLQAEAPQQTQNLQTLLVTSAVMPHPNAGVLMLHNATRNMPGKFPIMEALVRLHMTGVPKAAAIKKPTAQAPHTSIDRNSSSGAASEVSRGQYTPGAGLAILQSATRHQPGRYPECTKLLRCVELEPWKGLLWLRRLHAEAPQENQYLQTLLVASEVMPHPNAGVMMLHNATRNMPGKFPIMEALVRLHMTGVPRAAMPEKPKVHSSSSSSEPLALLMPFADKLHGLPLLTSLNQQSEFLPHLNTLLTKSTVPSAGLKWVHGLGDMSSKNLPALKILMAADELPRMVRTVRPMRSLPPGAGLAALRKATSNSHGAYPVCNVLLRCQELAPLTGLLWLRKLQTEAPHQNLNLKTLLVTSAVMPHPNAGAMMLRNATRKVPGKFLMVEALVRLHMTGVPRAAAPEEPKAHASGTHAPVQKPEASAATPPLHKIGDGLSLLRRATNQTPGRFPVCNKLLRAQELEPAQGLLWLRRLNAESPSSQPELKTLLIAADLLPHPKAGAMLLNKATCHAPHKFPICEALVRLHLTGRRREVAATDPMVSLPAAQKVELGKSPAVVHMSDPRREVKDEVPESDTVEACEVSTPVSGSSIQEERREEPENQELEVVENEVVVEAEQSPVRPASSDSGREEPPPVQAPAPVDIVRKDQPPKVMPHAQKKKSQTDAFKWDLVLQRNAADAEWEMHLHRVNSGMAAVTPSGGQMKALARLKEASTSQLSPSSSGSKLHDRFRCISPKSIPSSPTLPPLVNVSSPKVVHPNVPITGAVPHRLPEVRSPRAAIVQQGSTKEILRPAPLDKPALSSTDKRAAHMTSRFGAALLQSLSAVSLPQISENSRHVSAKVSAVDETPTTLARHEEIPRSPTRDWHKAADPQTTRFSPTSQSPPSLRPQGFKPNVDRVLRPAVWRGRDHDDSDAPAAHLDRQGSSTEPEPQYAWAGSSTFSKSMMDRFRKGAGARPAPQPEEPLMMQSMSMSWHQDKRARPTVQQEESPTQDLAMSWHPGMTRGLDRRQWVDAPSSPLFNPVVAMAQQQRSRLGAMY